jgi:hypothetical protein
MSNVMQFDFVEIHNTATKKSGRVLEFPIPKIPGDTRPGIRKLALAPGEKQIVPFEVATSTFGHPAEKNDPKNPNRSSEYRRLRGYFGFYEGFDTNTEEQLLANPNRDPMASSWEVKKPPFKVTTLAGDHIPMILDDPDGVLPMPESVRGMLSPEMALSQENVAESALRTMLTAQQEQIDELKKLLVVQASGGVAPVSTDDATLPQPPADELGPSEDTPQAPTVTRRKK